MPSAPPRFEPDSRDHLKKVRSILLGGFGGMLLLMILAGAGSLVSLERLNRVSREVSQQFSARSQALITVVFAIHSYDDQMEHFLLSDAVVSATPGAAEITKCGKAVHAALGKYPQDGAADERSLLTKIEEGVATQETSFSEVLASGASERKRRGSTVVSEQLMPSRTEVLRLASTLSDLNDRHLADQNRVLAAQFEGLETRLARLVLLTLIAGLLLSLIAGYYILRLEQHGRERYLVLVKSRQELERLSRRLVDAQEAERRSISRELHDEVGQTLGALLVDCGHLSALLPPGDKIAEEQVGRIRRAAETAVKSIRDMALLLRPPMLDDLGLVPALEWQARETSRRSAMEVEVDAGELQEDPRDEVKVCIYRLVQEALQNAASHARAKNAKVSVKRSGQRLEVEVRDDGEGFEAERTRGMGILGMEERVRQLGGAFFIRSAPGKGTIVHAELPLDGKGLA